MGIILFPVYLIWKSELVILSCFEFTPLGKLSQVMMNSMNVPSKRSTLEKKLDKLILALFATLFSMCVIGAIGRSVFMQSASLFNILITLDVKTTCLLHLCNLCHLSS